MIELCLSSTMEHAKKIKVYQPKGILIQLFGLMAPERWREETGLPFVRANLKDFLTRKKKDGKVMIRIEGLRSIARQTAEVDDKAPTIEEDTAPPDDVIATVIAFMTYQYERGRSNKATKTLENMVMNDGFERGSLKLTVYEDVPSALIAWHGVGCKIFVDCPHLASDEGQLYMKNTTEGDLARLVEGFYGNDKTFMTSEAVNSYRNILSSISIPIPDLLFITHIGQRAKQMADDFKIPVLLIDRNDNRKIRKYYLIRFRCVFKLTQTRFVRKRSEQAAASTRKTKSKSPPVVTQKS